MIKATTPISAGFAQAFDTSGIVQALEYERDKRHKRFEKNIKEFDSGQVWHRDIPEFTKKVNNYYEYVSDNYEALSNKSRNLDKWYEMKGMENDIANFTVASKAMGQNVDRASKLMLDKPELYDTEENRALIDGQITGSAYGTLSRGYETGEAHNSSFMNQFGRNIFVDTEEIQDRMREFATPDIEDVRTATIEGRRKTSQYRYQYDAQGMATVLKDMWDNGYASVRGDISSTDLKRKYGDFETFANVATQGLPEYTDPKEFTEPAPKDAGKPDRQFDAYVSPVSTVAGGHTVTGVEERERSLVGKVGAAITGAPMKKQGEAITEPYSYDTYTQGSVPVSGTKAAGYRAATKSAGWDMRSGQEVDLTEDKNVLLTHVDKGVLAMEPIYFSSITMTGQDGQPKVFNDVTVRPGQPLSPEMVQAIQNGDARSVDTNGEVINSVNAHSHAYYGPIAYSRTASSPSGMEISDPYSFINSLDEKAYRLVAQPYGQFKQEVRLNSQDYRKVEDLLEGIQDENPFMAPASDWDLEGMIEKGSASAHTRNQ
jgi:hypothetical protein